jgi:hypothetical protein
MWLGQARLGEARLGKAWRGMAGQGKARAPMAQQHLWRTTMFARRPENEQALERALKHLESMQRGEVLEHEIAARLFGAKHPSERYFGLIARLKMKLLELRGIRLIVIPTVGYELANVKGQMGFAKGRVQQAGRRIGDAHKTIVAIPEADCSFTELRAKGAMEERLAQEERQNRQFAQWSAYIMQPKEQRPRIARDSDDVEEAAG